MSRLISLKTYAFHPTPVNRIFPQNFNHRKVGTRLYGIGAWRLRKSWRTRPDDIARLCIRVGFWFAIR